MCGITITLSPLFYLYVASKPMRRSVWGLFWSHVFFFFFTLIAPCTFLQSSAFAPDVDAALINLKKAKSVERLWRGLSRASRSLGLSLSRSLSLGFSAACGCSVWSKPVLLFYSGTFRCFLQLVHLHSPQCSLCRSRFVRQLHVKASECIGSAQC